MLKIICEIEKDLENECYLSALALTLTIPAIFSKVFKGDSTRLNYVAWYDENVGKDFRPDDNEMPYPDGDVIYQLRCSIFHNGSFKPQDFEKIKEQNKVDKFILYADTKNYLIGGCSTLKDTGKREVEINIIRFCQDICAIANGVYKRNKEKVDSVIKTEIEIR